MAYVGGKCRMAKHILQILNDPKYDNLDYLEPFVGYAYILKDMKNKKSYQASDVNTNLINLLKHIKRSTEYPHINKTQYNQLKRNLPFKHNKYTNNFSLETLKAFAAYTYTFQGIEWDTYTDKRNNISQAEQRKRHYIRLHQSSSFQQSSLQRCSYLTYKPKNMLIYCDPPYNTKFEHYKMKFNHDEFWQTMREWSKDNVVFISEYNAPSDFECVLSIAKNSTFSVNNEFDKTTRYENLYQYKKQN